MRRSLQSCISPALWILAGAAAPGAVVSFQLGESGMLGAGAFVLVLVVLALSRAAAPRLPYTGPTHRLARDADQVEACAAGDEVRV